METIRAGTPIFLGQAKNKTLVTAKIVLVCPEGKEKSPGLGANVIKEQTLALILSVQEQSK